MEIVDNQIKSQKYYNEYDNEDTAAREAEKADYEAATATIKRKLDAAWTTFETKLRAAQAAADKMKEKLRKENKHDDKEHNYKEQPQKVYVIQDNNDNKVNLAICNPKTTTTIPRARANKDNNKKE